MPFVWLVFFHCDLAFVPVAAAYLILVRRLMHVQVKMLVTALIVAVGLALLFVDSRTDSAGPHWLWRGGRRDPVRQALFRNDGSLRRLSKPAMLLWLLFGIAVLWIAVPTD